MLQKDINELYRIIDKTKPSIVISTEENLDIIKETCQEYILNKDIILRAVPAQLLPDSNNVYFIPQEAGKIEFDKELKINAS